VVAVDNEKLTLTLSMLLKCADLGHLTAPWDIHMQWAAKLREEFFLQGDKEKAAGLSVMPMFDRKKASNLAAGQVGFIEFVALPMFTSFVLRFPQCASSMKAMEANLAAWRAQAR